MTTPTTTATKMTTSKTTTTMVTTTTTPMPSTTVTLQKEGKTYIRKKIKLGKKMKIKSHISLKVCFRPDNHLFFN